MPASMVFSPDGKTLAVATPENQVELWDTATGENVDIWELPFWVSNLSFSPDGSSLAGVDSANFTVHIWSFPGGEEQRTLAWTEHASPALYSAAFTQDWRTLAWVARGTIQLMDVASGSLGPVLEHEDFVSAIAIAPDGSLLASAAAATVEDTFTPVVLLWDLASGEQVNVLPQPEAVTSMAFSPDGRTLAVLTFDNVLRLLEAA
jgi:WD40 repeat protein